jgi:endonuclease/exonuclease/phosphatase family metal-dependent hydrolase
MTAIWRSARRVWFPPRLGGWITRLDQGFFRSAVSGQANAILLHPRLVPLEERWTTISRSRRERRICEAVRLEGMVIANLHTSSEPRHPEICAGETLRALAFAESLVQPGEALVLAGDFNLRPSQLPELPGFSPPGPRIDHILVRGGEASPLELWREAERTTAPAPPPARAPPPPPTTASGVLSDHAPIELRVG